MEKIKLIDITDFLFHDAGEQPDSKKVYTTVGELQTYTIMLVSTRQRVIKLRTAVGCKETLFKDEPETWEFLNKYFEFEQPERTKTVEV